jgi:hypothetical protein
VLNGKICKIKIKKTAGAANRNPLEGDLWGISIPKQPNNLIFTTRLAKSIPILYITNYRCACNNILTSKLLHNTLSITLQYMNCISCESWWRIACQNNIYRFLYILWYELWMGGNFEVLCPRGHTILLASDTMRLTDPSRKLCNLVPRASALIALRAISAEALGTRF